MRPFTFSNLLVVSIMMIFSCTSKNAGDEHVPDPIVISGKLTAPVDAVITLKAGNLLESINIGPDGSFRDTLYIAEGYYRFIHKNENTNIYLTPGKDLHVELNYMQFDESLSYSGEGAAPNSYLSAKALKKEQGRKTFDVVAFYSSEEEEYKTQMKDKYDADLAFLNSFEDLPESFLQWERKDIEYGKLLSIVSYKSGHEYFTKKTDFEPSGEFLKPLEEMDKDNDAEFRNLENYRNVVINYYSLISRDPAKFDQISGIISSLKSPLIKEAVLNDLAFQVSPSNENLSKLVALINTHSKDEDLRTRVNTKYEEVKDLAKGMPSPTFTYEDANGKMVSLEDLRGKLVYVDVWATWCGPCKREIPYLKEIEDKYHNEPIEFVSVSIDKQVDKGKWLSMVSEKELGGVQVIADKDWSSSFVKGYSITGIPRFLFIDKDGNIINADAPRPSDPKLETLFAEYLSS
ncbi:MAG: TlpA family protein disulfide reductase [Flavobacteriales bacterium]|nr:TlpA family protein disulfide reductase [Flavobacteriales bacterium]